ncbi:CLUMA_CG016034, isoform A [Clunio marinus]|uniref:CLUMA_CG016034, isoform A n=1 Tax=Clunio marinus TaxID=568069 RepID=A0A1J1IRJ9_9DIPT|nr:CLUMA_CG016034, isoform A [Clunio marinus]
MRVVTLQSHDITLFMLDTNGWRFKEPSKIGSSKKFICLIKATNSKIILRLELMEKQYKDRWRLSKRQSRYQLKASWHDPEDR